MRKGFTLIEVLVALVVTVAAVSMLASGFATGARASTMSQNLSRAALLAQQVLTDYETGELSLSTGYGREFPDGPGFTCEVQPEAGPPGLTQLTIVIKWEERGQERTFTLTRLMRARPESS